MVDFSKLNFKNIPKFNRGDPITAKRLNQPINILNSLNGTAPASPVNPATLVPTIRQFKIVEVKTDYVTAVTWDTLEKGTDEITIALPFLLRRTPFDFSLDNSIKDTTVGNIDIRFEYSSNTQRDAINVADESNLDVQVIVPFYIEDNIIYAMRGIVGGTDVKDEDGNIVVWQDMNTDSRAWLSKTNQDS